MLAGNQAVVFTVTYDAMPKWDEAEIVVQSLVNGERKTLGRGADARYVPTGHLVYVRAGRLVAVPFDLARLQVTGGAVSVMADVMQAANMGNADLDTGAGQFSVSASGALVYLIGGIFPDPECTLVWVDRTGATQPLPAPTRAYIEPRLSPDGERLVVWTYGTDRNVWAYDIPRGTLTRLTTEGVNAWAIWTPDGKRVAFSSGPGVGNLFWKPADGSETAERLARSEYVQCPSSWSPDGQTLAFVEFRSAATTGADVWVLPPGSDRQPRPLLQTRFNEMYPEFSPDGRWLAYTSNESGQNEVYVQSYPGPGPRQQASIDGGNQPAWARSGKELFYTNAVSSTSGQATVHKLMAVPVATGPSLTFGAPRMLFQGRYGGAVPLRGYDVTPDGRRFLMVQSKERPPIKVTQMILVQHWVEELKRLAPAK
jgi:serine/threonine-protein kinase